MRAADGHISRWAVCWLAHCVLLWHLHNKGIGVCHCWVTLRGWLHFMHIKHPVFTEINLHLSACERWMTFTTWSTVSGLYCVWKIIFQDLGDILYLQHWLQFPRFPVLHLCFSNHITENFKWSLSACYAGLIKCSVFLPPNKTHLEIVHNFCKHKKKQKKLLTDLCIMRAQCCISLSIIRFMTGWALHGHAFLRVFNVTLTHYETLNPRIIAQ